MAKTKSGQSAMEYLTTYGWALLVVVIVIAVLLSFNIGHVPEQCIFDNNAFTCEGARLLAEDPNPPATPANAIVGNLLYATLTSANPGSIQIVGMACTSSHPPARDSSNFIEQVYQVPSSGQDKPLILSRLDSFNTGSVPQNRFRLQCFDVDSSGNTRLAFLRPGTTFQGNLYVLYRSTDDSLMPAKLVTGRIVVGVQ